MEREKPGVKPGISWSVPHQSKVLQIKEIPTNNDLMLPDPGDTIGTPE